MVPLAIDRAAALRWPAAAAAPTAGSRGATTHPKRAGLGGGVEPESGAPAVSSPCGRVRGSVSGGRHSRAGPQECISPLPGVDAERGRRKGEGGRGLVCAAGSSVQSDHVDILRCCRPSCPPLPGGRCAATATSATYFVGAATGSLRCAFAASRCSQPGCVQRL